MAFYGWYYHCAIKKIVADYFVNTEGVSHGTNYDGKDFFQPFN